MSKRLCYVMLNFAHCCQHFTQEMECFLLLEIQGAKDHQIDSPVHSHLGEPPQSDHSGSLSNGEIPGADFQIIDNSQN